MDNKDESVAQCAQVAAEFRHPTLFGAIPGLKQKFRVTDHKGRLYSPSCSPPDLPILVTQLGSSGADEVKYALMFAEFQRSMLANDCAR